ncbi:hypothetical protein BY458DRAFT_522587 [Sporodiniella umbellata]|nr:hypothetical protein BY458DRAFT_522587 [Sporodiniella umbellata]
MTLKPNVKYEINKELRDQDFSGLMAEILFDVRGHIEPQMASVNREQRLILQRIKQVDDLSLSIAQSMTFSLSQKKSLVDKLPEIVTIKKQTSIIHEQMGQVFGALSRVEKHLDTKDRITDRNRWPLLSELHRGCTKKTKPSIENLIKSNSNEPSTTLESMNTVTSSLENIKLYGALENSLSKDIPVTSSSSTPSPALSRLRGLSSMSISKYSQ